MESYETYSALATDPELASQFGVRLRKNISFFPEPMDEHESEQDRITEIKKAGLHAFRHDFSLLQEYDHSGCGVADGFEHLSPVIDTDQAMKFLVGLLQSKGAILLSDTMHGDLWKNEKKLLETY